MTAFDNTGNEQDKERPGLARRTVLKGAAWSAPVIAVAIATPLAAASESTVASLSWTASSTSLLTLHVLDSSSLVTAQALTTVPTQFALVNGPGAISATATVTITVGRPSGINLSLGRARGFGVYSYNGVATPSASRTVSYQSAFGVPYGFPATTYTASQSVTVASNGTLAVPVEFGLAGVSDVVSISALANFPVTLTVDFGGGNSYTASTTISVPVGAGLL